MQQIKLFIGREDHTKELEDEVNAWIAEAGVEILSIAGNLSPQSVLPGAGGSSTSSGLGNTGTTRRFAQSDIMILVTYKKG